VVVSICCKQALAPRACLRW